MPKKKKISLRNELKNQIMLGMDGIEREVSDFFEEEDFDQSKDKKEIFVKHDALLRVAKKIFGGISARSSKPLGIPVKENDWCSVVTVTYALGSSGQLKMSATADCRDKTASPAFRGYTTQLAETRASGRALRTAMGLEVTTQEEITNIEDIVDRSAREPIMDMQKALINKKFINEKGKTFKDISKILGKEVVTFDQLTRGDATELLEAFNSE